MKKRKDLGTSNKLFYLVLVLVALLAVNVGVLAYGTGQPDILGHSGGEVHVDYEGGTELLQDVIDDLSCAGTRIRQSGDTAEFPMITGLNCVVFAKTE